MRTHYQLACGHCPQIHAVSPTQAGQTLSCSCGEVVDIPSLLALKRLPVAEESTGKRKRQTTWTPLQGMIFAAGLLCVGIGAYLHFQMNPARHQLNTDKPNAPQFVLDIQDISKEQSWTYWKSIRDYDLEFRNITPQYIENRKRFKELTNYVRLGWGLMGLGLFAMVTAVVLGLLGIGQRPEIR